jgi:hypothetical protein
VIGSGVNLTENVFEYRNALLIMYAFGTLSFMALPCGLQNEALPILLEFYAIFLMVLLL